MSHSKDENKSIKEVEKRKERKLKFQADIDKLELAITCPDNLSPIKEDLEAFRFCHDPIDINLDFLPNVAYDKIVGLPFNYSKTNKDDKRKCARCGASFSTKVDGLLSIWDNLNDQLKINFGYSTIAKGVLQSHDGQITHINGNGHFGFYEFEGSTFHNSFKIEQPLP